MPKQSPMPNEIDWPYYEACNQERLIVQYCTFCEQFQYPPAGVHEDCDSGEHLVWREVAGRGRIYSYAVIYDTPVEVQRVEQPYNCAVIELVDAPGINLVSYLPGVPVDEVPLDHPVELYFEETLATGQKVPEWRLSVTSKGEN